MTVRLLQGDCIERMRELPDCSVDAVVTDPPYGIRFMGQAWDGADIERVHAISSPDADARARNGAASAAGKYDLSSSAMLAFQRFSEAWAREAFRVLKPGGHLLSFSSTRTYHRMTCGIEAAGFEIRDQIGWAFGSGFPKSHNGPWGGTALKPAWEPICMARKPLVGTVAANVLAHGTGALNIDGCRVLVAGEIRVPVSGKGALPTRHDVDEPRAAGVLVQPHELGRWPANLIHDGSDEVVAAFPEAPGQLVEQSSSSSSRKNQTVYGQMRRGNGRDGEASADSDNDGPVGFKMRPGARRLDTGSAARFFYCAKASKEDRGEGNNHPTVKPTELMRYLVRLVTPSGGTVLDPFMGSGSTGKAAELEGFGFIGIELSAEYIAIARQRIAADVPLFAEVAA